MGEIRIGIITYPRIEDGEGRFLQAYALSSAISGLGYDNEILNYLPHEWVERRTCLDKIKRFIKNPDICGYLLDIKRKLSGRMSKKSNNVSKEKYKQFIKENLKYDLSKHPTKEELKNFKFDAWICGSDQIWNPHFAVGRDEVYYLQFAPKEKRISYAASMGTLDVDNSQLEMQKKWIQDIPYLAVRETGTCELINLRFNMQARHVCDPTFLMPIDWWDKLANKRIIQERYLLLFLFDNNPLPRNVAQKIANLYNLKIICISNDVKDNRRYDIPYGVGPEDFVSLFKYADFICTQSFHGIVLSLLFNRQFYVFDRSERGELSGLILRIKSLLSQMRLTSRIVDNSCKVEDCLEKEPIDFTYSNSVIANQRKQGLDFLKESIERAVNHNV